MDFFIARFVRKFVRSIVEKNVPQVLRAADKVTDWRKRDRNEFSEATLINHASILNTLPGNNYSYLHITLVTTPCIQTEQFKKCHTTVWESIII